MSSESDLLEAVKSSLQNGGHLSKFRAEIRSKVMSLLDPTILDKNRNVPKMPEDTLLMNELIREYLMWNGYMYSTSVFTAEADLGDKSPPRKALAKWIGLEHECAKEGEASETQLPLLFSLLAILKQHT